MLRCNLVPGETLNSVERFIPKLVNSLSQKGDSSEELYFLFPVIEDEIETQTFELLLKHQKSHLWIDLILRLLL